MMFVCCLVYFQELALEDDGWTGGNELETAGEEGWRAK